MYVNNDSKLILFFPRGMQELAQGQRYYVKVYARNSAGLGPSTLSRPASLVHGLRILSSELSAWIAPGVAPAIATTTNGENTREEHKQQEEYNHDDEDAQKIGMDAEVTKFHYRVTLCMVGAIVVSGIFECFFNSKDLNSVFIIPFGCVFSCVAYFLGWFWKAALVQLPGSPPSGALLRHIDGYLAAVIWIGFCTFTMFVGRLPTSERKSTLITNCKLSKI